MKNSYERQDGATHIIESMKHEKKIIGKLTDQYIAGCEKLDAHQSEVKVHNLKNRKFSALKQLDIALMFFMLFVGLPLLFLTDVMWVVDFANFLRFKIGGLLGGVVGFVIFFAFTALELLTGGLSIWIKDREAEGKNYTGLKWLVRFAMVVIVALPVILTYVGYELDPDKTVGKFAKTVALMVISAATHILIFASINVVWDAIAYFILYKWKLNRLRRSSPVPMLTKLKEQLHDKYAEFDDHKSEFDKLPEAIRNANNVDLGQRENLLKAKLTDNDPDNDFDISDLLKTKPNVERHDDNGGSSISNYGRNKIGFRYYTSSTL